MALLYTEVSFSPKPSEGLCGFEQGRGALLGRHRQQNASEGPQAGQQEVVPQGPQRWAHAEIPVWKYSTTFNAPHKTREDALLGLEIETALYLKKASGELRSWIMPF